MPFVPGSKEDSRNSYEKDKERKRGKRNDFFLCAELDFQRFRIYLIKMKKRTRLHFSGRQKTARDYGFFH